MAQVSPFETTETAQGQAALVSGSVAASEAAPASEPRNPDRLTTLPQEMILEIAKRVLVFNDKLSLLLTSRYLHQILHEDMYKSGCKTLNWRPLFFAARKGDMAKLNRCKELGAPANVYWDCKHDFDNSIRLAIQHGASPLEEAIMNGRVGAVKWLLAQGANPNKKNRAGSPLMRAFWMVRMNTIASAPANLRLTRRNQYSTFAMERLNVRAGKARRIIDLLLGAGADLTMKEAACFDPDLAEGTDQFNPDWTEKPSGAPWRSSFDPGSIEMSDWLLVLSKLGLSRVTRNKKQERSQAETRRRPIWDPDFL